MTVHWLVLFHNLMLHWFIHLNFSTSVSQWSWMEISPYKTCNNYSFHLHVSYIPLLVAVSVNRCLSAVWLNAVFVFYIYGHTNLLHNILKLKLKGLFHDLMDCLKLEIFAKIDNSFQVFDTFLDNHIIY